VEADRKLNGIASASSILPPLSLVIWAALFIFLGRRPLVTCQSHPPFTLPSTCLSHGLLFQPPVDNGLLVSCWGALQFCALHASAHCMLHILPWPSLNFAFSRPLRPGLPFLLSKGSSEGRAKRSNQQMGTWLLPSLDHEGELLLLLLLLLLLWVPECFPTFSGRGLDRLLSSLPCSFSAEGPFAFKWDSFLGETSLWESCVFVFRNTLCCTVQHKSEITSALLQSSKCD